MAAVPNRAKRRRVMPVLISSAEAQAPAAESGTPTQRTAGSNCSPAAAEGSASATELLPADAVYSGEATSNPNSGEWNVQFQHTDSSATIVCQKEGSVKWTKQILKAVQHHSMNADYLAFTSGLEVHVLRLCSGEAVTVFGWTLLDSIPLVIQLAPKDRCVLLLKSAQLLVFDLAEERSLVKTSVHHICKPGHVQSVTLHSKTLEPILILKDRKHFLFSVIAKSWIALTGIVDEATDRQDSTDGQSARCVHLESDLFSAACFSPGEFQVRLALLGRHLAVHDVRQLRRFCAELLSKPVNSLFARTLDGLGLCGRKLLTDDLLPALRELPVGQQLCNELTASSSGRTAVLPPIF